MLGRSWQGENMMKLIHDDCLNAMKSINLNDVIIVSDPPFNQGYHYNKYHDKMNHSEYLEFMSEVFKDKESVIIHYPEGLHELSVKFGYSPQKVVSWVYNSNTGKQHRDIAFYNIKPNFRKVGQPYKNPNDKRIAKKIADGKMARLYDWWNINQVKNVSSEKTAHPCQMPLEVMKRIIGILPDNKVILDPFLGSGTTGVACKQLGRDFIGIEMDKKYFEIAQNRINEVLI